MKTFGKMLNKVNITNIKSTVSDFIHGLSYKYKKRWTAHQFPDKKANAPDMLKIK